MNDMLKLSNSRKTVTVRGIIVYFGTLSYHEAATSFSRAELYATDCYDTFAPLIRTLRIVCPVIRTSDTWRMDR